MEKGKMLESTSSNVEEGEVTGVIKELGDGFKIYQKGNQFRILFLNEIISDAFESEEGARKYYEGKPYALILTASMILHRRLNALESIARIEEEVNELNTTEQ